jgi:hypothetical protein
MAENNCPKRTPTFLRSDNGPEFVSRGPVVLDRRARHVHGVDRARQPPEPVVERCINLAQQIIDENMSPQETGE